MLADAHNISNRHKNHFRQLLNVLVVSDIRQTEKKEPLVPQPSASEAEMAIGKLKGYKSPGTDQIQTEMIKTGKRTNVLRSTNLLILFGIRRKCLSSGRSLSLYLFIRRVIKQTVVITEAYHLCQLHTKCYPISCCQGQLHMQSKLLGLISVDFNVTGQLLIIYSASMALQPLPGLGLPHKTPPFIPICSFTPPSSYLQQLYSTSLNHIHAFNKYWRKYGNTMKQCIRNPMSQLAERSCIIFSLSLSSGNRKTNKHVFKLGLHKSLGRQTFVYISTIKNGVKQGDALSQLHLNLASEYASRWVQVNQEGFKLNGTYQHLVYAEDVTTLYENLHTLKKNTGALLVTRKEAG